MSITIISPKSNYLMPDVNDGISENQYITWEQNEGTQTGYEIMYKLKSSGTWNTTGKIDSSQSKHPLMDIYNNLHHPFEEIYYKVKVFTEDHSSNDSDGSMAVNKSSLVSDTYSVIFKSGMEVSVAKVFDGNEVLEFPVYDTIDSDTVDDINIIIDETTGKTVHLPIVEPDSPIAGDTKIAMGNGETKHWAKGYGDFDDHVLTEPDASGEFWGYYSQNYIQYSYGYRYAVDHYDTNYQYGYKPVSEGTYVYEYAYDAKYDRTDSYYYRYVSGTRYNSISYDQYAYTTEKETGYQYSEMYYYGVGSEAYVTGYNRYTYYVPGYTYSYSTGGSRDAYYYYSVYVKNPIYKTVNVNRADYANIAYRYISYRGGTSSGMLVNDSYRFKYYYWYSYGTGVVEYYATARDDRLVRYTYNYAYSGRSYVGGSTAEGTESIYSYRPEYYAMRYYDVNDTYYYYRNTKYSYTVEQQDKYNTYNYDIGYKENVKYYYQYSYAYDIGKIYRYATGYDKTMYNYTEEINSAYTYYTSVVEDVYDAYYYYTYYVTYKYEYLAYASHYVYTAYKMGSRHQDIYKMDTAYYTRYRYGYGSSPGYYNESYIYYYSYHQIDYYNAAYDAVGETRGYGYAYDTYADKASRLYHYRYDHYYPVTYHTTQYKDIYKYYAYTYFYNPISYIRYQYVSSYTPVYYNQKYMYIEDSVDTTSYYYYQKAL